MQDWLTSAEQILLFCQAKEKRFIGFVSAYSGAGVTTCAVATASLAAQSGYRTLLVNLSKPVQAEVRTQTWVHTTANPMNAVVKNATPFDLLTLNTSEAERYHFNNADGFREALKGETERYDYVILDLPAILDRGQTAINPVPALIACGCALFVAELGRLTRQDLADSLDILEKAGVGLDGMVLNEGKCPPTRLEIASSFGRLLRFFPGLAKRVEQSIAKTSLLD